MPEPCRFYGIVIRIHIPDHPLPIFTRCTADRKPCST